MPCLPRPTPGEHDDQGTIILGSTEATFAYATGPNTMSVEETVPQRTVQMYLGRDVEVFISSTTPALICGVCACACACDCVRVCAYVCFIFYQHCTFCIHCLLFSSSSDSVSVDVWVCGCLCVDSYNPCNICQYPTRAIFTIIYTTDKTKN